jgi:DNA primase
MLPREVIQEVLDRTDIVDVVSRYVDLKRAGKDFKALCPFHEERTPSFFVAPDKQIFHCFGCQKGGDAITFVREMEGVGFMEAVRTLADWAGVQLPSVPSAPRGEEGWEHLYRATEFAAGAYQERLYSPQGAVARRMLEDRGIPESAWKTFQLGYAPDAWDFLARSARARSLSLEPLVAVGLVRKRERGGWTDLFRNRVIFPIHSVSRRVLAIAGRVLPGSDEPKYINSPESPIFHKREALYGIAPARGAIKERRRVVVVEGYTDCIRFHLRGVPETVATLGTALTEGHAFRLRRVARRAILVPDGDRAGWAAAVRGGAILAAAGLDVQVYPLPEGEDPDSWAAARPGEIGSTLGEAMDYFEYLSYIRKEAFRNVRDREALARRVAEGLATCRDRIRLETLAAAAAEALELSTEALVEAVRKLRRHREEAPERGQRTPARVRREKLLLRMLLDPRSRRHGVFERLDAGDFSDPHCRTFYKLLDEEGESAFDFGSQRFRQKVDEAGLMGLLSEVALTSLPPGDFGKLLDDTVKRIKADSLRDGLQEVKEKLKNVPEGSEEGEALARYFQELKRELADLQR